MTAQPGSHDRGSLRLLGITLGDVADPLSAAGVNHALFSALDRQSVLVGVIDAELEGVSRYLVGGLTIHQPRSKWRHAYYKNPLGFDLRTRNVSTALRAFQGNYNFVLQLKTLCAPGHHLETPYAIYTDNTHRISQQLYPAWDVFWTKAQRRRWYEREEAVYNNAALAFVRSEEVRQSLLHDYGLPPHRVIKVGAGTNYDPLPEVAPRRATAPTLLFVGKDFQRKGGLTLLKAYERVRRKHPTARLRIVGPSERIQGDGVEWLGPVRDREQLANIFREATIFVHPAHFEPWGNVILEAMAFGLPCVATNIGGIPEMVVDGETGALISPGDVNALVETLDNMLSCLPRTLELGRAGHARVIEHFTWNAVTGRLVAAINNYLSTK